jgi:hypothetical protein
MFQFPPCPPTGLYIQPAVPGYCPGGFPHSGILGLTLDDSSPRLNAAIHALHRPLTPRHPPYALSSLIHARRQYLIRLTYSAQLLRCQLIPQNARDPASSPLEGFESLDGAPELPRTHRPVTQLLIGLVGHKIARLITGQVQP